MAPLAIGPLTIHIDEYSVQLLKILNYLQNSFLIAFLAGLGMFSGCREKKSEAHEFEPNTGQIQVLNGCGFPGAAEEVRNYLIDKGFDIVEFGNAPFWNFKETMVVARTENFAVARDLGIILNTENVIKMVDSSQMVDATIIVGKDYYKRLK